VCQSKSHGRVAGLSQIRSSSLTATPSTHLAGNAVATRALRGPTREKTGRAAGGAKIEGYPSVLRRGKNNGLKLIESVCLK
jgi:hypothetical protein